MPKIFEYLGIIIMFYSNEHEPIHVHGKFQALESKAEFIIQDGKIIKIKISNVKGKKPLSKKELKEFKNFVNKFKIREKNVKNKTNINICISKKIIYR